jgi:hypothetical protein
MGKQGAFVTSKAQRKDERSLNNINILAGYGKSPCSHFPILCHFPIDKIKGKRYVNSNVAI